MTKWPDAEVDSHVRVHYILVALVSVARNPREVCVSCNGFSSLGMRKATRTICEGTDLLTGRRHQLHGTRCGNRAKI